MPEMLACRTISGEGGKTRLSVRTDSMVDDMVVWPPRQAVVGHFTPSSLPQRRGAGGGARRAFALAQARRPCPAAMVDSRACPLPHHRAVPMPDRKLPDPRSNALPRFIFMSRWL